ncbi:hypothetical protein NIES806_08410 [Dolichospermum compactum NIES-806]|uniref:Uncharacterized protein n=1 Tax=Dolichospermum compactum NIES-806 TaxID=1973481 RepID=A0A1Z4UZH1_9CYAN|nr:hypothetical protein NIES806_08410 [Dolichospermum compactum NIES-806]
MTGKITYLAYNRDGGDKSFRSLLTPHSARTNVRAVPYGMDKFSSFLANVYPLSLRGCFCYGRIFTNLGNILCKGF